VGTAVVAGTAEVVGMAGVVGTAEVGMAGVVGTAEAVGMVDMSTAAGRTLVMGGVVMH